MIGAARRTLPLMPPILTKRCLAAMALRMRRANSAGFSRSLQVSRITSQPSALSRSSLAFSRSTTAVRSSPWIRPCWYLE